MPCPTCQHKAEEVVLALPVYAADTYLLEVWYCMLCQQRYAVLTLYGDDAVHARKYLPQGVFADLPKPWRV